MGRASHILVDTVTIAQITGRSLSGDPTFGTQSTIPARVERLFSTVIDDEGNEVLSQHKVASESEIRLTDSVWLPGDDTTSNNDARRPIATTKASTPDGYTLFETFF